jgi:hypothetical protein
MDKELKNRIILANNCYHGFKGKFKSHFLTLSTKFRLYKTLLTPVLMYGSESCLLTRSNEWSLSVLERKVFQRIFGSVCENGFWHIQHNNELHQLFSEPNIVKTPVLEVYNGQAMLSKFWMIILLKKHPPKNRWV